MELRGRRRANKPQSGLFSRHYHTTIHAPGTVFPPRQPPGKLSLSFQALHLRNSYKSVTIVTTLQGKSQRRLHSCSVSAVLIAAPCCRCSAGISAWAAKFPAAAGKAPSRKGQKALR